MSEREITLRNYNTAFCGTQAVVEYVISQKGKRMIKMNGYTYSSVKSVGAKTRWKCSTHQHRGCQGALHTIEDEVIFIKDTHTHPEVFRAEYVQSKRGKKLIKLNNYTYYSASRDGPKTRWRCSTHASCGCNACLYTFKDEIVGLKDFHNHPAPHKDPKNVPKFVQGFPKLDKSNFE
ncbi:jg8376 [Pararge aegeria aegeria]|uniref:Jg8376 protein n=1 Tax=Pararge aegeria aegeria TaxID=348720 RepID=A0A8S4SMJ5_9NEOP|nr:jg8376 [Pararge aegeria aegeria]